MMMVVVVVMMIMMIGRDPCVHVLHVMKKPTISYIVTGTLGVSP